MANRAFLKCTASPAGRELGCKYTLPDGWLLLFDSEDFHVGNKCSVAGLCSRGTSSYLLADAGIATARFARRMTAARVPIVGHGIAAQFYALLCAEFGKGWLFVDTTELEWMRDSFVEDTRNDLRRVDERTALFEPSPGGVLMEYGWGTGLSREENQNRRHPDMTALFRHFDSVRRTDVYEEALKLAVALLGDEGAQIHRVGASGAEAGYLGLAVTT